MYNCPFRELRLKLLKAPIAIFVIPAKNGDTDLTLLETLFCIFPRKLLSFSVLPFPFCCCMTVVYLFSYYCKSKRRFPAEFKLANGKIISDHKEIADAFNDYFIGIGAQDTETPQGNSHYSEYLSNKPNFKLEFHPITNCDVAEIIGNLKPKTSTGIDHISSKLFRQTKDSITESLTIIVNQMLITGTFP